VSGTVDPAYARWLTMSEQERRAQVLREAAWGQRHQARLCQTPGLRRQLELAAQENEQLARKILAEAS
jgi:hypothetical protein